MRPARRNRLVARRLLNSRQPLCSSSIFHPRMNEHKINQFLLQVAIGLNAWQRSTGILIYTGSRATGSRANTHLQPVSDSRLRTRMSPQKRLLVPLVVVFALIGGSAPTASVSGVRGFICVSRVSMSLRYPQILMKKRFVCGKIPPGCDRMTPLANLVSPGR